VRFALAGEESLHIPEVLYHWRQHKKSLSNSGVYFEGSGASTRGILDRIIATRPDRHYEVRASPSELGIPDSQISRLPSRPPDMFYLGLAWPDTVPTQSLSQFPFVGSKLLPAKRGRSGIVALRETLETIPGDLVLLVGSAIGHVAEDGLWAAIKHLEFFPDVLAVGGPILGVDGRIVRGAVVRRDRVNLVDATAGRAVTDPGPFSLALKAHCVDALAPDLLVARRSELVACLRATPQWLAMRSLAAWLCAYIADSDRRLVYEPQLRGIAEKEHDLLGDRIEGLQNAWSAKMIDMTPNRVPRRGMSGFFRAADLHNDVKC
jgi:hypothetical protein